MADATLSGTALELKEPSVTRRMAAALPELRDKALAKGLTIHHLGAGYPHPEVTDPTAFISKSQNWFQYLSQQEGINDPDEMPQFLKDAYAYTDTLGPTSPREAFAKVYGNDWGVQIDPRKLIPTIGATGGIAILCSLFERRRGRLGYITDSPTYAGFVARAELSQESRIFSVEMDSEGPLLDVMRQRIHEARDAGYYVPFYYTVPDGHNPAGISFSQQRRADILSLAVEEDILVVEDSPYLYISYLDKNERPAPFFAMDPQRAVHLFTGSKIGLPGPRIGFVFSEAKLQIQNGRIVPLTDLMLTESSAGILFHNPLSLLAFEGLLRDERGQIIDSMWPLAEQKLRVYRENREIAMKGLQAGLGSYPHKISWTQPDAGFFTAVKVHDPSISIDNEFALRLVENYGVVIVPMYDFYPDDARGRNPRAGFDEMRVSFCFTEGGADKRRKELESAVDQFCVAMQAELSLH